MSNSVIELKNLAKNYGANVALKDVSLSLAPGHFYALVGRNGAGKSTLMRILMRQERLSGGSAFILGQDVESDPADFNRNLGFVSEAVDFQLPVPIENFFWFYGKGFERWNQSIFDDILKRMEIDQKRYFRTLSRGQRMHVATAAAMATQPKILMLDEVTAVLDPDARAFFMEELSRYVAGGGTVLIATNILSEVQNHADHLILLHDGTVKLSLPVADLQKEFLKLRKAPGTDHAVFSNPNCIQVGRCLDGSTLHLIHSSKGSDVPQDLRDSGPISAEEVFVQLTRSEWK